MWDILHSNQYIINSVRINNTIAFGNLICNWQLHYHHHSILFVLHLQLQLKAINVINLFDKRFEESRIIVERKRKRATLDVKIILTCQTKPHYPFLYEIFATQKAHLIHTYKILQNKLFAILDNHFLVMMTVSHLFPITNIHTSL